MTERQILTAREIWALIIKQRFGIEIDPEKGYCRETKREGEGVKD